MGVFADSSFDQGRCWEINENEQSNHYLVQLLNWPRKQSYTAFTESVKLVSINTYMNENHIGWVVSLSMLC
jgi:hypothetical protein